jgi:hypothetical protein
MSDRRAAFVAVGLGLALAGCGGGEKRVVDQYFGATNQKDNQTIASFAVVGFDQKVDNWTIANTGPENRQPAPLVALVKKAKDADAAVSDNKKAASAFAMDHLNEVDAIREAHKKNQPVPAKLSGLAADWDKFNQKDRDLKRAVAEAKDGVEKEKRIVALSVGPNDDVESLTGDMLSKDLDLVLTIGGQPKHYGMTLRKYELSAGEKAPKLGSRWVIYSIAPKA